MSQARFMCVSGGLGGSTRFQGRFKGYQEVSEALKGLLMRGPKNRESERRSNSISGTGNYFRELHWAPGGLRLLQQVSGARQLVSGDRGLKNA